jgi:UDP-N-acetylmuramoyl-L-alanyl-D-glutamate--2,6-diaminopimelate ligase
VQMQELVAGIDVVALRGDPRVDVETLTHDSRRVRPGACFACIVGARTDGHVHAPEALAAGAVALLVERPLDLGVTEAEVRGVRAALGPAAARLHGDPSRALRCLGVTGTNGKTTTTYLLEAIATAAGERVGVVGTTGARIDGAAVPLEHTTPEASDLQELLDRMRTAGVATVALEVSSHALSQHRVDGTWFTAVGFTNLSHEHLDYHESLEAYFEAKARLFEPARAAYAAVNLDDAHGVRLVALAKERGLPTITFGVRSDAADVVAAGLDIGAWGSRFVLHDRRTGDREEIRVHLAGEANVANALAAAGTALAGGFGFAEVAAGLGRVLVVPGRLERVDAGQPFAVLVDYAHTPDALAAALGAARRVAGASQVVVVFGCGGERDREKRPLMGAIAARDADVVVVTSDNPRSESAETIAAEVLAGIGARRDRVLVELDRRAAIRVAFDRAGAGDAVLIAGKGHETGQTAGGITLPFDDRVVAREELGARAWS